MDHEPDWIWWSEARAIAARQARGASDAADDLAQELALERGADVTRPGAWLELRRQFVPEILETLEDL